MKNLIYVLAVVFMLYSCNGSQSGSTTGEAAKADSTAATAANNQTQPGQLPTDSLGNPTMPPEPEPGNAVFEFETTEHDFGKIKAEAPVEYAFKFKNTGTEPLVIAEARGSCGCTVPSYTKEPVAVGGTGEIKVAFDPKGKSGIQRKSITVTANTNPVRTTLNIVSDVIPAEGQTAPPAQ